MMENKWLAKITRAEFGKGGYQDAMVGFSFSFEGAYGVGDFWGVLVRGNRPYC
jgi:hypothetical protein